MRSLLPPVCVEHTATFTQASPSQWIFRALPVFQAVRKHCRKHPRWQGTGELARQSSWDFPSSPGGTHCFLYLISFALDLLACFAEVQEVSLPQTPKTLLSNCLTSNMAAEKLMPTCFLTFLYHRWTYFSSRESLRLLSLPLGFCDFPSCVFPTHPCGPGHVLVDTQVSSSGDFLVLFFRELAHSSFSGFPFWSICTSSVSPLGLGLCGVVFVLCVLGECLTFSFEFLNFHNF